MNSNSVVLTGVITSSAEIKEKNSVAFAEWIIKVNDADGHANFILIRTGFFSNQEDAEVLREFRVGKIVTISGFLRVSPDRSKFYVRAEEYEIIDPNADPGELF